MSLTQMLVDHIGDEAEARRPTAQLARWISVLAEEGADFLPVPSFPAGQRTPLETKT
jgi:hypothetical protein